MPRSIPIRSCTSCGALFKSPRREAPPSFDAYRPTEETVRATRCATCGDFIWVTDAPTIGELPMTALHPVFDVTVVDLGPAVDEVKRALVDADQGCIALDGMPIQVTRGVSLDAAVTVARRFEDAGATVRIVPSYADEPRFREWAQLREAKPLTAIEAAEALAAGHARTPSRVMYLKHLIG